MTSAQRHNGGQIRKFRNSSVSVYRRQGMLAKSIVVVLLCVALSASTLAQSNWTQFRGAGSTGVASDDPNLPDHWSQNENVVWKTDIPGVGWSSPIVWGDSIFVTSVVPTVEGE